MVGPRDRAPCHTAQRADVKRSVEKKGVWKDVACVEAPVSGRGRHENYVNEAPWAGGHRSEGDVIRTGM